MEDIQNNVKALSDEKNHFKMLYKQVWLKYKYIRKCQIKKTKILYAHVPLFLQMKAQEDLKLTQRTDLSAEILRLQEEVRRAEVKLEQVTSERNSLMERLKVKMSCI